MRKIYTGRDNITLSIRVPTDEAIRIVGRLWAKGIITDKQYLKRLQQLDVNESKKVAQKRLELQKQLKGVKK